MFLEYNIVLKTPLVVSSPPMPTSLPSLFSEPSGNRLLILPGSGLKGMARNSFRSILGTSVEEEDTMFGSSENTGKIMFSDIIYDGEVLQSTTVGLDRTDEKAASLDSYEMIPAGSKLKGKVHIAPDVTVRQINVVRHSIYLLSLTRIGNRRSSGHGECEIEFPDLESAGLVYLSYAWEDDAHKEWVLSLADNLVSAGIGVIFDQYDLTIGDNIHVFMEDGIARAKKVLIVFTPFFKEKASSRHGGVGFEYSLINGELFDMLAENNKFLPILRKGDVKSSIPPLFREYLYCDMRDDSSFDKAFQELYFAILGTKQVIRPKPPWTQS